MSRSQPQKRFFLERIEYSINEEVKTASVTDCQSNATEIIIPRSIKHESNEYIVTIISSLVFSSSNVRSVSFEPNSELRTIEKGAFSQSKVTSIKIPASVVELKDEWFIKAENLSHVEVEPGNARYSSVGGKMVIGKSDIANEDYDTLVFCTRDTMKVNMPSTIKIIGSYAFSGSKLESILIPSHVTKICETAFYGCYQLSRVEFEPNSELRTIEKYAFNWLKLTSIQIPSHVTQICEHAFASCKQLSRVEFEPNSELRTIGKYAFSESRFESILIPSRVTRICELAFYDCNQLSRVEFEPNSELRTIEKEAFSHSKVTSIQIPASAVELEDGWCSGAENLIHVGVEPGNARYSSVSGKLIIGKSDIAQEDYDTLVFCARDSIEVKIPSTIKIIGAYSFSGSKLSSILIPSHVTQIREHAFYDCKQLSRVEFEPNSELRTIGEEAFSESALKDIKIPSHITTICDSTFYGCNPLFRVEFEPNSELQTIGEYAFSESAIVSIQIPSHVTRICEGAFAGCMYISRVEFAQNSELQTIEKVAFSETNLPSILIPSHVTNIDEYAFSIYKKFQIVEIEENSVYESISMKAFSKCKIVMLPVGKNLHKKGQ